MLQHKDIVMDKVTGILFNALDKINTERTDDEQIPKSMDIILWGKSAVIDSLGLAILSATLEEDIFSEFNKQIQLGSPTCDEEAEKFMTLGSLHDYIIKELAV